MKPLTTIELNRILKNSNVTNRYFIGTVPSCVIPKTKKRIYSFITNTDEHDKPGEHWNCWFVRGDKIFFFDSFGRTPDSPTLPIYYREIIKDFGQVEYSTNRVQGWLATTCGYFCVDFIYILSLGLDFKNFMNKYSRNYESNDNIVIDIVDSIL